MKVPSYQHSRDDRSDQAMTPMIDVVFLLLIFFVLASLGYIAEGLLTVDQSRGDMRTDLIDKKLDENPWVTKVWLKLYPDPTGRKTYVEMNGREFQEFEALERDLKKLAKLSADSPIILDVAAAVPCGDLIRIDDACRAAGFESISYAADEGTVKKPPTNP